MDTKVIQLSTELNRELNKSAPYVELMNPDIIPMEEALEKAFQEMGHEKLGGASGHGWSRWSRLQRCPFLFYLTYEKEMKRDDWLEPAALATGSAFHAFVAVYYLRMIHFREGRKDPIPEPGVLCDLLLEFNANAACVNEAWRIFEAYANFYETRHDYLEPLAVEELVKDPNSKNTARYDLIARVPEDVDAPVVPGTYICEHKSSSRLDRATTEGWHLDGEIIGQIMLWHKAKLYKKYGKLQGVIVNIVTKTKDPKCVREIVTPPTSQMRRQAKDLEVWKGVETIYRSTKTWPRALAGCWGRYGPCDFFEYCRDGGK